MSERIVISETQLQPLKGQFPDVPTYPHVDTVLLYQGDEANPFHVTLPIAEIGRVSDNGLEYDEELVTAIAEQMSNGAGGIRGHIPDDQLSTAYPVDDVHWIGHQLIGQTLWAKGYIPPGQTREDIRMKKARGGNIATSIFGDAVKEFVVAEASKSRSRTWKARQFQLEQIDLAPTKRAALKNRTGFVITREMEGEMPPEVKDNVVQVSDVPEPIREQIIRESDLAKKVERLAEMETKVAELGEQVSELVQYKQIVMEIRSTLGKDTDTAAAVAEQHKMAATLAEMLGVEYSNITITVSEMHESIKELKQKEFDNAVTATVSELTKWDAKTDAGKAQVDAFRKTFKRTLISELKGDQTPEKLAEIAQKLWDDEYSVIGAAVVSSLSGPGAFVPPKAPISSGSSNPSRISDEMLATEGKRYGGSKN